MGQYPCINCIDCKQAQQILAGEWQVVMSAMRVMIAFCAIVLDPPHQRWPGWSCSLLPLHPACKEIHGKLRSQDRKLHPGLDSSGKTHRDDFLVLAWPLANCFLGRYFVLLRKGLPPVKFTIAEPFHWVILADPQGLYSPGWPLLPVSVAGTQVLVCRVSVNTFIWHMKPASMVGVTSNRDCIC